MFTVYIGPSVQGYLGFKGQPLTPPIKEKTLALIRVLGMGIST